VKSSKGSRKRILRQWLAGELFHRFAGRILSVDAETALRWDEVSAEAERTGRPVLVMDGLMAASAMVYGLALITRNMSDVARTSVPFVNPWAS